MSSQLLVNPYPYGSDLTQRGETLSGSVLLAGAAVSTGEPLDWSTMSSGIRYAEINFAGNGVHGSDTALVTGLSASGGVITVTAANNFVPGQLVTFKGCTTVFGLLMNGLTFTVSTVTTGTSFTIVSAITATTTSSEVGFCYTQTGIYTPFANAGAQLPGTITALSASNNLITVTCANTYLPGTQVTFLTSGTTGTLGAKLVGLTLPVVSSTGSAFIVASALTGSTDTGTCLGTIPPQPYSVKFWSALDSGYTYQYNSTFGTLFALQTAAITPTISIGAGTPTTYPVGTAANTGSTTLVATGAVTVPINATTAAAMGNLAAAAYPAGVLGDVIKFEARFAKER